MSTDPVRVIINADDFGHSAEHNAGIIKAYSHGVISSTSLMIGGDCAEEAVDFARQNPALPVGLHVAFSDVKPVLPPEEVSSLVQPDGRFPPDDHAHRVALLTIKGRRQMRAEIAAQFRAFFATGLACDHMNTHRHAHRLPPVGWMVFREASCWPVNVTRIPWDPPSDAARRLRFVLLKRLGVAYGLTVPDRSIGREPWTVPMLVELLARLPVGNTELYFHPVDTEQHRYAADLPILLNDDVKAALAKVMVCGLGQACNASAPKVMT